MIKKTNILFYNVYNSAEFRRDYLLEQITKHIFLIDNCVNTGCMHSGLLIAPQVAQIFQVFILVVFLYMFLLGDYRLISNASYHIKMR